jgi:hypothetical protein
LFGLSRSGSPLLFLSKHTLHLFITSVTPFFVGFGVLTVVVMKSTTVS